MHLHGTCFSGGFQAIRAVGPLSYQSSLTGSPSPSLGREVQLSARPGFFRPLRASLPYLTGLFHPAGIHGIFPSEVCSRPEPDTSRLALPFCPFRSRHCVLDLTPIQVPGVACIGGCPHLSLRKGFQTLRPGFQSLRSGGQLTRQIRHVPARGSASDHAAQPKLERCLSLNRIRLQESMVTHRMPKHSA